MTEDVITDLGRYKDLLVIARNSTMAYKGKPVDARQVAKDLNVRFVLAGSVQHQADQLRVTADLIDADDRRAGVVGALGPAGRRICSRSRRRSPTRSRLHSATLAAQTSGIRAALWRKPRSAHGESFGL